VRRSSFDTAAFTPGVKVGPSNNPVSAYCVRPQ
jgi:hypothetical protein